VFLAISQLLPRPAKSDARDRRSSPWRAQPRGPRSRALKSHNPPAASNAAKQALRAALPTLTFMGANRRSRRCRGHDGRGNADEVRQSRTTDSPRQAGERRRRRRRLRSRGECQQRAVVVEEKETAVTDTATQPNPENERVTDRILPETPRECASRQHGAAT